MIPGAERIIRAKLCDTEDYVEEEPEDDSEDYTEEDSGSDDYYNDTPVSNPDDILVL